MSTTVWTYPNGGMVDSAKIVAWCESNGIPANSVKADGFHITQDDDGSLTAHGEVYALQEDGSRTVVESGDAFVMDGKRSWPVSSVPQGVEL